MGIYESFPLLRLHLYKAGVLGALCKGSMNKPKQVVEMRSVTAKVSQAVQIFSHFLIFNEEMNYEECSEIVVGHF